MSRSLQKIPFVALSIISAALSGCASTGPDTAKKPGGGEDVVVLNESLTSFYLLGEKRFGKDFVVFKQCGKLKVPKNVRDCAKEISYVNIEDFRNFFEDAIQTPYDKLESSNMRLSHEYRLAKQGNTEQAMKDLARSLKSAEDEEIAKKAKLKQIEEFLSSVGKSKNDSSDYLKINEELTKTQERIASLKKKQKQLENEIKVVEKVNAQVKTIMERIQKPMNAGVNVYKTIGNTDIFSKSLGEVFRLIPLRLTQVGDAGDVTGTFNPVRTADDKIMFSTGKNADGFAESWIVDPLNPENRQRTTRQGQDSESQSSAPALLPDGKLVLSTDKYALKQFELWITDPKNPKDRKQLTSQNETHSTVNSLDPKLLSDGRILYRTNRSHPSFYELWIVDPKNPEKKVRLTKFSETHEQVNVKNADVLPDGRIIYSTDRSTNNVYELWTIDPKNPDSKVRITKYNETHNAVDAIDPIVLPEGEIVYRSDRYRDGVFDLWVIQNIRK